MNTAISLLGWWWGERQEGKGGLSLPRTHSSLGPTPPPLLNLGPGTPQALHIPLGGSILQARSRTGHVKVLPKVRALGHPLPSLTCHPGLCSKPHPDSPGAAL